MIVTITDLLHSIVCKECSHVLNSGQFGLDDTTLIHKIIINNYSMSMSKNTFKCNHRISIKKAFNIMGETR